MQKIATYAKNVFLILLFLYLSDDSKKKQIFAEKKKFGKIMLGKKIVFGVALLP